MTLRAYTIGMLAIGLLAAVSWFLVLFFLSPDDLFSIWLFLISLFLGMMAVISVLGFYLRLFISKNELVYIHLKTSLRQGTFLSLIATGMLALQGFKILTLWDGGLFVASIMVLEFYFLSRG